MKRSLLLLGIAAVVLHHDFWWWESSWPVFGFLPIGLAYHATLSLVGALFWFVATRGAWQVEDDRGERGERE